MASNKFDFYDKTTLKSYNLDSTMRYQLSVLDGLDKFTREHSENVASIVCRICEYLRLNKNFTAYCTICAYLHDIGKIFIPKAILNKPSTLTDEEYEIMKTHTTLGYKMCMDDLQLRPYSNGPLFHHESLDGSGYPTGITKKDIPYEDQIIKVADEYDALVSKRQYTTHINISETLKELMKETEPSDIKEIVALDHVAERSKYGKMSKKIVRTLFKVVIDDTEYEICGVMDYVKYLKKQLKRLDTMENYYQKMIASKDPKKQSYYKEGIKVMLDRGETIENFRQIHEEYKEALKNKQDMIEKLYNEIKIIKKLQV